ncbi:MAG: copper amine oxidase N-terminal domain-containing protein [Oscillospiraceae bacterium]|jgi:hypothetical protein|nr:copper amine oxidase N-terminal domain-containing protein [Oscillospiraceae bacterium]
MKRISVALLLIAAILALAACTANEPPAATPSPSPTAAATAEPSGAPEPSVEPSASPAAASTDESVFRPFEASATLEYNGSSINAAPYRGANDAILLPLQPLAEAMGWKVEKSVAGTSEAILITKAGKDDVTIEFIPASVGQNQVSGVTARKGTTSVKIDNMLFYADGTIYVDEAFIDDALEAVDVTFDGGSLVSVKPSA